MVVFVCFRFQCSSSGTVDHLVQGANGPNTVLVRIDADHDQGRTTQPWRWHVQRHGVPEGPLQEFVVPDRIPVSGASVSCGTINRCPHRLIDSLLILIHFMQMFCALQRSRWPAQVQAAAEKLQHDAAGNGKRIECVGAEYSFTYLYI